MVQCFINGLMSTVKKTFCMSGRATRCEFWSYTLTALVIVFSLLVIGLGLGAIANFLGVFWMGLTLLVYIALFIPCISLTVRRLHDVNLTGFWYWYLCPVGLPIIFIVYLLNLDSSANNLIEKIKGVGSIWLGWILALLCWPGGAAATLFLLFLYRGTKGDNDFGPDPLAKKCPCKDEAVAPATENA